MRRVAPSERCPEWRRCRRRTRIVLLLVAIVALSAFTGFTVWRQHTAGAANAADAAELKDAIAGKIAALNLPTRTVELPTEKARHVRDAIERGDFATADKIFAAVLSSSHVWNWRFYPFTDFIKAVVVTDDPAFGEALDAWVAKDGSDAAARLIRAHYEFEVAWARRGHAYSNDTAAAKLKAFQTYTGKALADCTRSLKYGSIPDAYSKQMKLMKLLSST